MLKYQPKPGAIVKCDFNGYIIPEIVKRRPVVVIHSHKTNPKLVTIVPISATAPSSIEFYHYELNLNNEKNIEAFLSDCKRWFKCDLVYVVSIDRLDRYKHRTTGKRDTPQISSTALRTIKEMVRLANGL
jgi:uncharacterized protein YifN (PemK superfamily)